MKEFLITGIARLLGPARSADDDVSLERRRALARVRARALVQSIAEPRPDARRR